MPDEDDKLPGTTGTIREMRSKKMKKGAAKKAKGKKKGIRRRRSKKVRRS